MSFTKPLGAVVFRTDKALKYRNKVSLVMFSSCNNTGSIIDDPYWNTKKNSLELIEILSVNKVSLVLVSSSGNVESIKDESY